MPESIAYAKLLADIKASVQATQNRAAMAVTNEKAELVANCDQAGEGR